MENEVRHTTVESPLVDIFPSSLVAQDLATSTVTVESTSDKYSDSELLEATAVINLSESIISDVQELNLAYTISEVIVALLAVFGNALVIYVFCTNRSLRKYRNYYIVALACADLLVGLFGIPFAILASVGLPRNLYGCLFTVSILLVLCTASILCLLAVSIDRYWATTNPFAYYRNMTTSTAVGIILSCWFLGALIGFLPLLGWYNLEGWNKEPKACFFTDVMDYSYLVFIYFTTIVFPALLMAGFYGYIYSIVRKQIRQKGTLAPQIRRLSQPRTDSLTSENRGGIQVMRFLANEKRREAKAAKKLGVIVLFFLICWMPLYTINCIQAFCPQCQVPIDVLNFTIILSHANSALNPFLYSFHLKDFRSAMKLTVLACIRRLVCCFLVKVEKEEFPNANRARAVSAIANISLQRSDQNMQSPRGIVHKRNGSIPMPSRSPPISISKGNLFDMSGLQKSTSSLSTTSDLGNAEKQDANMVTSGSGNCTHNKSSRTTKQQHLVSEHQSSKVILERISENLDGYKNVSENGPEDIFATCKIASNKESVDMTIEVSSEGESSNLSVRL